jgi:hypothetical protein
MREANITAENKELVLKGNNRLLRRSGHERPRQVFRTGLQTAQSRYPEWERCNSRSHHWPQPRLQVRAGHDRCGRRIRNDPRSLHRLGPEANGRSRHLPCGGRQARRALGRYAGGSAGRTDKEREQHVHKPTARLIGTIALVKMVVDAAIFRAASRASKATDFIPAFRKPADDMSQHEDVAP